MKQDRSLDSQSLRDTEKEGGESTLPRLLNMGKINLKKRIEPIRAACILMQIAIGWWIIQLSLGHKQ